MIPRLPPWNRASAPAPPEFSSCPSGTAPRLLECAAVGNWKQVQARIRKARTGADAPAKLEQLFLKTHDAMVAFELAKLHESGQREADALDWYKRAYEHFRRDEWRVKAAEAIQRLGGTPPVLSETPAGESSSEHSSEPPAATAVPTPREWAALPDRLFHESGIPPRAVEQTESSSDSPD